MLKCVTNNKNNAHPAVKIVSNNTMESLVFARKFYASYQVPTYLTFKFIYNIQKPKNSVGESVAVFKGRHEYNQNLTGSIWDD